MQVHEPLGNLLHDEMRVLGGRGRGGVCAARELKKVAALGQEVVQEGALAAKLRRYDQTRDASLRAIFRQGAQSTFYGVR